MVVDLRVVVAERPRSIGLGGDTLTGRDELVVNIVRPIANACRRELLVQATVKPVPQRTFGCLED